MVASLRALICIVACVAALAGCGSSSPGRSASDGATVEHADRPAPLPAGWRRVVNQRAGFSIGLPPGWSARGARGTTLVRSADRAFAIGISADRSDSARSGSLQDYARRIAHGLPGYGDLQAGSFAPLQGAHYPGVRLLATGTYRRTGVRQAIDVIAIRRGTLVTYTLAAFRTAKSQPAVYAGALAEMVRSFRAQPPEF